jgi:hypothetical protein
VLIPSDTFSAEELASLTGAGASALLTLVDSAMRLRPSNSSDGAGGQTVTWGSAGPYHCFVAPVRQWSETQKAATEQSVSYWKISFAAGTDILPKDRLTVNGSTFEVTETDAGATSAFLLICQCVRVR